MFAIARRFVLAAVSVGLFGAAIGAAQAAGALAIGVCGAYGYGFDYTTAADARAAAMRKCTGGHCRIVGVVRLGCAAMAVDARHPCGSYGWALNSHLGKAENMSMQRCAQFGGRQCVVRAWACDEKG
jgi:Domain of unknown function (DUF4189)